MDTNPALPGRHADLPDASVHIRAARSDDAAAVAVLAAELGYPTSAEQAAARLDGLLRGADHCVLVAESDGVVIGWTHVFGCRRLESDPFAEIGGLVVAAAHRSRSIGARLMAAAEAWAAANRYREMRVRSNVVRERAHGFYLKIGYECAKRQMIFVKTLA